MAVADLSKIRKLSLEYSETSAAEVETYQLAALNDRWQKASAIIPYYQQLKTQFGLPDRFDSISRYTETMPVLEKSAIQNKNLRYFYLEPRANHYRITGGSTASPTQIPSWKSEFSHTNADGWIGKRWYRIEPGDKCALYWGHSHLLGSGLVGFYNYWLRRAKDKIQNYYRISCYDLSDESVREAGNKILKARPKFLIGYSSALDRLARINADRQDEFAKLRLKAVIATAEAMPFLDSEETIAKIFCAPVAMEYGAVETNILAHSHPAGGYKVFWKNYILEAPNPTETRTEVYVSSLYERCTPLFRYKLGDLICVERLNSGNFGKSLLSFDSVVGRSNQMITLPNGKKLHSETVSHIVRDLSEVSSYQFDCSNSKLVLNLVSSKELPLSKIDSIYRKARIIDEVLSDSLEICYVDKVKVTIAGKTPMVICD